MRVRRWSWRDEAACVGRELTVFFPVGASVDRAGPVEDAKRICDGCPVREWCLAWAMETGTDHGVFGGLDPDERRRARLAVLRRKRLRAG